MQKLQAKLKNVPKGVYQAPCSTSLQLNKEETLSVVDKVLTCNNLDGNLLQQAGGLKTNMLVLSKQWLQNCCLLFQKNNQENLTCPVEQRFFPLLDKAKGFSKLKMS